MTVQVGLCRTCSETTLLVFPRDGSFGRERSYASFKNVSNVILSSAVPSGFGSKSVIPRVVKAETEIQQNLCIKAPMAKTEKS